MVAKHSGKLGDLIFSIPAARALGVTKYLIPDHGPEVEKMYYQARAFLTSQGFEVSRYPDCDRYESHYAPYDIDLDLHRTHKLRGLTNMVQRYYDTFKLGVWNYQPWIDLETKASHEYAVINVTPRFRDNSRVNWGKVIRSVGSALYFVGMQEEHRNFVRQWGEVRYLPTVDILDLASVIAGATKVYCNQSLVLALACGMDKERYVEYKPNKQNCKFFTPNEHILL